MQVSVRQYAWSRTDNVTHRSRTCTMYWRILTPHVHDVTCVQGVEEPSVEEEEGKVGCEACITWHMELTFLC